MAMFVHLTPESQLPSVRRNGLSRNRRDYGDFRGGVYAVPVTRNFFVSHQWLRELKRRNCGPMAGVYFRIDDEQPVWVGHYGQAHQWLAASQAVAIFNTAQNPEGWEVVIPRRIEATEIHRTRSLPQVIGWRYFPNAHGKKPCGCDFCQRGLYGGAKLRSEFNK